MLSAVSLRSKHNHIRAGCAVINRNDLSGDTQCQNMTVTECDSNVEYQMLNNCLSVGKKFDYITHECSPGRIQ